MANQIECTAVAARYERVLRGQFGRVRNPTLATLLTSDDDGSVKYQQLLGRDCAALGVRHVPVSCQRDSDLSERIHEFNLSLQVHGMMVFYPLGRDITIDRHVVANSVSPQKDVEGLNRYNLGALTQKYDDEAVIPATARAVVEVLQHHKFDFSGKTGVVLNRSDIVGRPLSIALENLGMTVFAAYDQTDTAAIKAVLPHADLVVTAVPDPSYRLQSDLVKPGSAVIAVTPSNIVEEDLHERCKLLTVRADPIGRVTRKITMLNLLNCIKYQMATDTFK